MMFQFFQWDLIWCHCHLVIKTLKDALTCSYLKMIKYICQKFERAKFQVSPNPLKLMSEQKWDYRLKFIVKYYTFFSISRPTLDHKKPHKWSNVIFSCNCTLLSLHFSTFREELIESKHSGSLQRPAACNMHLPASTNSVFVREKNKHISMFLFSSSTFTQCKCGLPASGFWFRGNGFRLTPCHLLTVTRAT